MDGRRARPARDRDPVRAAAVAHDTWNTTASFALSSDEAAATFQCKLDAAATFTACPVPSTFVVGAGPHTLLVRAIDISGNVDASPAAWSWEVVLDTTAPVTTIETGPPASIPPVEDPPYFFGFTSNDPAATFECSLDSDPFAACETPYEFTSADLAVGPAHLPGARDRPGRQRRVAAGEL